MTNENIIKVKGLGKRFKLYKSPGDRAKEWLTLGNKQYYQEFWALRDISFELKPGESLAIIGPNGAGKSTLLKILSGVLRPTQGEYQINGRLLSLLELGTGFNPELTGRQNIFYSTQLLGFSRAYLEERLPDIEAFAELGDYLDRPLKFYSSGMKTRLGFSLFASLDCDVLVVDEVLAVGDVFFRQKCYARLEELQQQKTTVILVTHSMSAVQEHCKKAMVLHQGQVVFQGDSLEAIKHYFVLERGSNGNGLPLTSLTMDSERVPNLDPKDNPALSFWPLSTSFLNLSKAVIRNGERARCSGIALCNERGDPCQIFEQGEWAYFYYEFEIFKDISVPIGSIAIWNDRNLLVHGKTTLQQPQLTPPFQVLAGSRIRFRQSVKLDLVPGDYTFRIGLATINYEDYTNNLEYMSHKEIASRTIPLANVDKVASFSITIRTRGLPLLHHGLCNLPGDCNIHLLSNAADAEVSNLSYMIQPS